MRIVCDRCKEKTVDFDFRNEWRHIKISQKGYGDLGDYYLCPECSESFYDFLDKKGGGTDE